MCGIKRLNSKAVNLNAGRVHFLKQTRSERTRAPTMRFQKTLIATTCDLSRVTTISDFKFTQCFYYFLVFFVFG